MIYEETPNAHDCDMNEVPPLAYICCSATLPCTLCVI